MTEEELKAIEAWSSESFFGNVKIGEARRRILALVAEVRRLQGELERHRRMLRFHEENIRAGAEADKDPP